MIASKSISRIWSLGFEIVVCIMVGVTASNALAAQATLAWDANTESDLAGYKVHYGTVSGSYSVHTDVHNVTTSTVAGQTYYFAVTAYNASGNESGCFNQVSYSVPSPNGTPTTPATPTGSSSALVNTARLAPRPPTPTAAACSTAMTGAAVSSPGMGRPTSRTAGPRPGSMP